MQVLCRKSMVSSDVRCSVCGQSFVVFWERSSPSEQAEARSLVMQELREQHIHADDASAHPDLGFNVPAWDGSAAYSGAALLGNAPAWAL
jgi:hypothetical protein